MIPQYTHNALRRARTGTLTVDDKDRVLDSLQSGDPITMKDAVFQPVESQKRKKLLADLNHIEVQLGRLAKTCREIRAEVLTLKTED